MKIDTLRIRNFRCYTDSIYGQWGLVFRPRRECNLIIGQNGSGKTAVLDAIDILMNAEGRTNQALLSEYDFPYCDTSKTMCIEITLIDLGQAIGEFESDIQWIDPKDGEPIENKGVDLDDKIHLPALIIRFEAFLDPYDGEIKWFWLLPKFPETELEKAKELTRAQHVFLGYFRIRPTVTAGAFTLGQYSALGRHLRKLEYRLGKLPEALQSEAQLSKCSLENPKCEDCENKSDCLPDLENSGMDFSKHKDVQTIGLKLGGIVSSAKRVLGSHGWNRMNASLGPRYGGLRANLSALTLGLRIDGPEKARFIPFERLSAGEKYSLSFSLAMAQVPGDRPPVIIMEEPETSLYPSAVATLLGDLKAIPSGDAPQVIVSSHSEGVLRFFSLEDIFIMDHNRQPLQVRNVINNTQLTEDLMTRLESLIMPGGPSVLFADKILLVEGAQDAIVSGHLDRLSARIAAEKQNSDYNSFSSLGWCIFEAAKASKTIYFAKFFISLGKRVVSLFDGDGPGKEAARGTKYICPTFVYKSEQGGTPTLEDALLLGLPTEVKNKVLDDFYNNNKCSTCMKNRNNCWKISGEDCYLGDKANRKNHLQKLCLKSYLEKNIFPPHLRYYYRRLNLPKKELFTNCLSMLQTINQKVKGKNWTHGYLHKYRKPKFGLSKVIRG
ncbi:ATP-dependent endonuclease [Acidobacteriota bacterium]